MASAEGTQLWFVELTGPPTADGGSLNNTRAEKNAFRAAAARDGVRFTERYAFDVLFNGLSVQINPADVPRLSRLSNVKSVYPVEVVSLPAREEGDPSIDPQLVTALAMTGADVAQNDLGLTGAGVRVGVMDTGIDYDHPDLGGCFGTGCRVSMGWDFVGDAFNADSGSPAYNPVPVPGPDPDDCHGHGTHVAGIVGANGTLKGVAPNVTFGAYRVFGCAGSTLTDVMIAAMERALADRMHILNISIGAAFQWPEYPTAQAASRLVNRGVIVVASIGNSGANGLYSASAPGVGDKVIGVASFNNTHTSLPAFTISPDNRPVAYSSATGAPLTPTSGTFPLARTGTQTSAADACAPLPAGSLNGHVALIRRGTCGFHDKVVNAQNAGAEGVVIYNNAPGIQGVNATGAVAVVIPVVAISQADGHEIDTRLAGGSVNLTWTATFISTPQAGSVAGLIASSSSYGMTPTLSLKPDIGAPGGAIRSTYPLEFSGGYASLGGTSMAAPHVAGAVALLLEARPSTPAQAVRGILQNSASPRMWWGNPGLGFLDNVHRQGAGMLNVPAAIRSTTKVEPSALPLGESEAGPATHRLTIDNASAEAVTYILSHAPALSTGPNTFTPSFFTGFAGVTFSAPTVTVPPNGKAQIDVTISANPTLADRSLYGGYVVLTPEGGGQSYRVPYGGLKGDYQSMTVLAPTPSNFPWLAQLVGSSYFNRPAGQSYTMVDNDVPFLLVHLDHQVRRLRVEVFDAASGKAWHRAIDTEYYGRNSTATAFFAFAWDGRTVNGRNINTVPNGAYVLRLSVLKALGDASNPAHWESWTSPTVVIARP